MNGMNGANGVTICGGPNVPEDVVVVLVIDERRDAAVRVVLGVFGSLLLEFVKVEVDALVGEAKFGQDEGDLPFDESRGQ